MEMMLIPRTLQEGTFTRFDVSEIEINGEMYLRYIRYRIEQCRDLASDANSYNYFCTENNMRELADWLSIESNRKFVEDLDFQYQKETEIYHELYDMYLKKDYTVGSNYRMLKTGIEIVDLYITKETMMQVVYTTQKYGYAQSTYFFNIWESEKLDTANKLKELYDCKVKLANLMAN